MDRLTPLAPLTVVGPPPPEASSGDVLPVPSAGLLLQFLAWVAVRPRTYGETMDAWRTSCPRLSVWEDACEDGLVQIERAIRGVQGQAKVTLTAAGAERLKAWVETTAG